MLKRRAGQAGLIFAEMLHQLGRIAMLLVILGLLGVCLLGYRLSFGPLEIPYLASELATVASGQGISVVMERAELAWDGYRQGGGVPLDLQLGGIVVRNAEGVTLVEIPAARLVVSPSAFLSGEAPLEVTGAGARFPGSGVPVSLLAAIRVSRLKLSNADLRVTLGAGRFGLGADSVPIEAGSFRLVVTPRAVTLLDGRFALGRVGRSAPHIGLTGDAALGADWQGRLRVTADAVEAADLAAYWPPDLVAMTRAWVTGNITAGRASEADFTFTVAAPRNLARVAMNGVSGGFEARGLTLTWLPGAVPITALDGRFDVLDRNVAVASARGARVGGVDVTGGTMRILGLSAPHQTGELKMNLAGPLPAAIAILAAPPLNLLRGAPVELGRATGEASVVLQANFPLSNDLPLDELVLNVAADLRDVAFIAPVTGLAFTEGNARLTASMQSLKADAAIRFAGEPARLGVEIGFARGGADYHVALDGQAGPVILGRLGVNAPDEMGDSVAGRAPFHLAITGAPDGAGEASLSADLTPVALALPRLGWGKAAGKPGHLALDVRLMQGDFNGLRTFSVQGPGLNVQGRAKGAQVALGPVMIGRTRAAGTLTPPGKAGGVWALALSGPELDVRVANPGGAGGAGGAGETSGPGWRVAVKFDRVDLAAAPAPSLGETSFSAAGQGGRIDRADGTSPGIGLTVRAGAGGRRDLELTAKDGGALIRALGLYDKVQGGDMDLAAQFGAGGPVAGTLTADKFRLLGAPAMGKILQGLTVYGISAATSGPGLAFDHAVAPFSATGGMLRLNGARAFSSSLGFTGTGRISLDDGTADIHGTIIPAYAINALPGKIPVIGKLFSAQKGGGLFALNAHVTGKLSDPKVQINPLSALTPGVLRDVFGLGGAGS